MPDYRKYCSVAGITNRQMVEELKKVWPKYGKPTQTMVCDPSGYAVQLLPEAEEILVRAFGYAPGLAMPDPEEKKPRSHDNKQKPHRLYVRLDDALMSRVKDAMERMHFATAQDMIEAALYQFCDRYAARPVIASQPAGWRGNPRPKKGWGR